MDDILRSIRRVREAFAASMGYDVHRMGEYLRNLDGLENWPKAERKPQRAERLEASGELKPPKAA